MEWAYASHSGGSLKITSSRSGFIATALGNLLTVYKASRESIQEVALAKRFDNPITAIAMSSVYNATGNNYPNLFVGTSAGKGYFIDISNMSIIAVFDPPTKSTLEGLILTRAITSATWSPMYPGLLFVGLSNGQIFSVSLVKRHEEQEYPYFTTVVWAIEKDFSIDFLEFDVHTENTLVAASRTGIAAMINDVYIDNPVESVQWKQESGIVQCQFYHRFPKCVMVVSNNQVDFILIDEARHINMFSGPSQRPILGIWVPRVIDNMILVMTMSRIFVFAFEDGSWRRKTEVPYFEGHYASHTSLGSDKVVVTTDSGNMIVYELRRGKIYMRNIHRGISKPTTGSCNGTLTALGKGNTCYVLRNMETIFAFQIPRQCEIDEVAWISDDVVVIAAHETQRNKLFAVSMRTRQIHSILKQRHELLIGDTLHLHVCQGKYFAVVIGGSLLMFYSIDEVPREISNNLFNDVFHMSFRNDNLANVVTMNKCIVCKIDPYSQIMHIPINRVKGKITAATTFPDKWAVVGTNHGDIYRLKLHNADVVGKLKGQVQRFIVSPDMKYMIAIDVHHNFTVFDSEFHKITDKRKVKLGFCVNSEQIMLNFAGSKALTLCNFSDMSHSSIDLGFNMYSTEEAKEMFKEQVENVTDLAQVRKLAEDLLIFPVSDVLSPFSGTFEPKCYGMNVSVARFKKHIVSLLAFLRDANNDRELRIMHFIGKKEEAIAILLATKPENQNFSKNSIKAAIACANIASDDQLTQTVDSLVSGGCVNDAIDVLLLKSKYTDALKLLIVDKNIEMAVAMLQTLLLEADNKEHILQISTTLKEMDNQPHALAFLMSCKAYTEVVEYLHSIGDNFTASVVQSIEARESDIVFNPEKFKELTSN